MEWYQAVLTAVGTLIAGAIGGALTLYFWFRNKLSESIKQEQMNAASASERVSAARKQERLDVANATEIEDDLHDKEVRRIEARYEERITWQEARHLRETQERDEMFIKRIAEIDGLLKEHSAALKVVHQENEECQRRHAKLELKHEVVQSRYDALKSQNEDQELRLRRQSSELIELKAMVSTCAAASECPALKMLDQRSKKTDEFPKTEGES